MSGPVMPGVVYVVSVSGGEIMKVGRTSRPKMRFAEHRKWYGHIEVIYTQEEHNPSRVECLARRILRPHKIRLEEFKVDADTAVEAVKRAGTLVSSEPVMNTVFNRETGAIYNIPLLPPPRQEKEDAVIFAKIRSELGDMKRQALP